MRDMEDFNMRFVDITGERYGILTALRKLEKDKWGNYFWECECDCGKVFKTTSGRIRSGMTKSCGCLRADRGGDALRTHGLSSSPEYSRWASMLRRCNNPNQAGCEESLRY